MNPYSIIKKSLVTEQTRQLKEKENKYVFVVDKKATKNQIRHAIKQLFDIDVEKITTMIVHGKLRRLGKYAGYRPDWKKAIVKLKKGQEIKVIEETR
ncbi:MAG: 50S ribosomal protein L23 [Elusimicrobia bacterium CG1_02_37_114]|nr:MAG: 50S ribosomal protein L23 [Elusimicrobia bacterium CG1_02_37_114]PIV52565.1 MAG: 50S ribosomal protein L23 [Elusimicrobia bacterium CG02_land_8_20_14_3_00_37_13]